MNVLPTLYEPTYFMYALDNLVLGITIFKLMYTIITLFLRVGNTPIICDPGKVYTIMKDCTPFQVISIDHHYNSIRSTRH